MRLRLPGSKIHEEGHCQWNRDAAPPLPLPGLPANRLLRPDAKRPPVPVADHVGFDGTDGYTSIGHPEGRHVVLFRPRHHQERMGSIQFQRLYPHSLRLYSLRRRHGRRRRCPARSMEQRSVRRRAGDDVLQLPSL